MVTKEWLDAVTVDVVGLANDQCNGKKLKSFE